MDPPESIAISTVVLIVGASLLSGPFVGLSLTTEEDAAQFNPGTGTLEAAVVSTPDQATLEAARYGVEGYYLRASPVNLRIHGVTGQPSVAYDIIIEELHYTRSSIVFLDTSNEGAFSLEFERATLDAERIDRDEFTGTIRIAVIDDDGERTVAETDIRIVVIE